MIAIAQKPSDRTVARWKGSLWTGRVLSALAILFLFLDGVAKLVKPTPGPVVEAMARLGYPESAAVGIGLLLIACTILYAIPRTSVIGALLLTAYLGGATASHVRIGADLFPILFPSMMGILLWGGLILRDFRLRALLVSD